MLKFDSNAAAGASASAAERKAELEAREFLDRRETAEFLRLIGVPVSVPTLAKYACQGGGPEMVTFGRRCLYQPAKIRTWVAARSRIHGDAVTGRAA